MKTTNIITGNYVLSSNALQSNPFKGIALISNYQQNQKAFGRIVNDILSVSPNTGGYKQFEPAVTQEQLATSNEHQSSDQRQQQDSKFIKVDNNGQQNSNITSDEFVKIMEMYNNKQ